MDDRPAVLGGSPAFADLVPVVQPTLPPWEPELAAEVGRLMQTGMLTKGQHLAELETRVAAHLGVGHAVGVASATTGLLLVAQALGLSGEVIVPSFTFMATVHPLALLGVEPVFVDVDPSTWNMDVREVERAITPRTSAIFAVHVFGNPADVAGLEALAAKHGVRLVFDAAHGFGAGYRGQPVGRFGDAEVFSMSPTKLLVAGEGGIVATDDDKLADAVRAGREYGNAGSYDSMFPGINGRLPEFNALLAVRGLEMLDGNASRRRELAAAYEEQLGALPGLGFQAVDEQDACSYKDFSMRVDEERFGLSRDELAVALHAENVDTRSYYDPPVHRQRAYAHLRERYEEALPVTETLARESLSIPIWSHMPSDTLHAIGASIARIHGMAAEVRTALAARAD